MSLYRHVITSPRWDPDCCGGALVAHGQANYGCATVAGLLVRSGQVAEPGGPKTRTLRGRPGNRRFWESKRPSSSSKPTGAGGGRSPPPAPVGFEEEDGRFGSLNRRFPGRLLEIKVVGPLGASIPSCSCVFVDEPRCLGITCVLDLGNECV